MTNWKLTYFNARGGGEVIRLVFAAADVKYEDIRITQEQWKELKPKTPFGQVPFIEVDGVKLSQSNACARFIARKYQLAGKTELEEAQADMMVDCFMDSVKPAWAFFYEADEAKKAELQKKYNEEQLPGYLTLLEALRKQNHGGDGFLVGTGLTWADLWLLQFVSFASVAGNNDVLAKYPKLKALHERVEKQPRIAAWIANRPKTER